MSAWVSPPQLSVSHIVAAAASIAHAASTALPPLLKVSAPALAASGLPVIATQWLPCSGGLLECLYSWAWPASISVRLNSTSRQLRSGDKRFSSCGIGELAGLLAWWPDHVAVGIEQAQLAELFDG